ncbi:acyltransferase [Streptomyces niveiscabiei]|uniref:acyltransferase n=1 Tax=Streptomyces niveiscabiei TaxID=164115 RepID=UPI003EBEC3E2
MSLDDDGTALAADLGTEGLLRLTVTTLMTLTGERQGDLAAAIGQAQAQISRKQGGRQHWTLEDVDRLAAHYRIHVLDLLAGPTRAAQALPAARRPAAVPVPATFAAAPPAHDQEEAAVREPAGPCVLCGQPAADEIDGYPQHLTPEECARAVATAPSAAPTAPAASPVPAAPVAPVAPVGEEAEAAAQESAAPLAPVVEPAPAPAEPSAPVQRRTPGYASEALTAMITGRVQNVLAENDGDIEIAQSALIKSAIPDVMALFKKSRVGGRYAHSEFPPTDEILQKKSQKGADEIWEGRPKWRNKTAYDLARKGQQIEVTALDMNAAYLSAFKVWLPVGKLIEEETDQHHPKKSGVYLITPPEWEHDDLPNPLGFRKETGPVWVPDSMVRTLLDCASWDLSAPPVIHRALLSGGTEILLEKLRRALADVRKNAIEENDEITTEYVKSMYSKFVSTIGESAANTEIRRPDWMHIIRTKAFTNLWRKAYKAREAGLTVIEISGTDELHIAGDWRPVFPEGRNLSQVKEKNTYMLGGSR